MAYITLYGYNIRAFGWATLGKAIYMMLDYSIYTVIKLDFCYTAGWMKTNNDYDCDESIGIGEDVMR